MDDLNQISVHQERVKKFFTLPKIIFGILGLILMVEFIYAAKTLTAPAPAVPKRSTTAIQKNPAKISLKSGRTTFEVGETVPVFVLIDTGAREVTGADVIVRFDPKNLEATSGAVLAGRIFEDYPQKSVDSKAGVVSISGVSGLKGGFSGQGQLAVVNFKAKATGPTSLVIDFKKGSTADSNLVETVSSQDILEAVDNLELNIK